MSTLGGWPKRIYEHTDLAISKGHTKGHRTLYKFGYPQPYYEKTDLECRVSTNTTNNAIGASFQGVLIKNTT